MRNAGLEEAQAGIKMAGRYMNNLRYADDTILMAESEELKSLLMKVKEKREKVGSDEIVGSIKELLSTSAFLTMPKPLTVWITTNRGKF